MKKQLLTESFVFTPTKQYLAEGSDGKKRLIAEGQFGKADIPTANGRIYPKRLWVRELQKLGPKIEDNQVYGELDHPMDGQTKLQRVCHLITGVKLREDGVIWGKLEILPETRNGKQAIGILNGGGKVGISSRGFGSIQPNEEGNDVVQDDFNLMTWDLVADPAAAGSFPDFKYEEKQKPFIIEYGSTEDIMANKKTESFNTKNNKESEKIENEDKSNETKEKEMSASNESLIPESTLEKIKEQIRNEESEKAVKNLMSVWEEKEKEIKESLRSELLSDPEVAGARMALENVKKTLRPFIVSEDINEALNEKESVIEGLETQVTEKKARIGELEEALKEVGFKLRVEQIIADVPQKKKVRMMVGDVRKFESMEELDGRLKKALMRVREEEQEVENILKKRVEEKEEEISKLREETEKIRKGYQEAVRLAEDNAAKAYLERKIYNRKDADQIRKAFLESRITKKESIDRLVESFRPANRGGAGSKLVSKIHQRKQELSKISKSENKTLVEDHVGQTAPSRNDRVIVPGVTEGDVLRLST